ncbi:MAG: metal ABC transporter substrate-binding protein [Oscillospiraceae bacterium]|nr:metal ABC transporter substrate-binding protein [Oscillospiraceae bacterium]
MKKITSLLLAAAALSAAFTGCSQVSDQNENSAGPQENEKIQVVATIFPEYDWAKNIIGEDNERFEVSLLINSGTDMHSFQPSADDVMKIADADIFIYVGGESDEWVDDILRNCPSESRQAINCLDVIGENAKVEELSEGMQECEEDDEAHEEDAPEYDEHIWLSLKNASVVCDSIAQAAGSADSTHKDVYEKNLSEYKKKLSDLDGKYKEAVDSAVVKTLMICDRFPFRYLTDDYGIEYYAAFSGCSAETEASFETVAFLAGKADELGIDVLLIIDGSDGRLAETVAKSTKTGEKKIVVLDSMQSVTMDRIENGETYLLIMEHDLEVLKTALR